MSPPRRALGPRAVLLAVTVAVVVAGAAVGVPGAQAKPSPYRATPVSGTWFVTGCVPTSVPTGVGFPMSFSARCVGEVTGDWTGYYVDDESGTEDASLSMRLRGVITLYAQAADGTCGSLRILTRTTTDGSTDRLESTAKIVGGTGDWIGSRGAYRTSGIFDTAVGTGEFHGTWLRPRRAPTAHEGLCPPPAPVGPQP